MTARLRGARPRVLAACVGAVSIAMVLAVGAPAVGASDSSHGTRMLQKENAYHQTNLVSDLPNMAAMQDPDLVNPWGISAGPSTPFWISDNGADVTTLYSGAVNGSPVVKAPLRVSIPDGAPTGQVFNPTNDFVVTSNGKSGPAKFLFASENGSIDGWNQMVDMTNAVSVVTTPDAVYKGLAMAETHDGPRLYAANFRAGTVDVFDGSFMPVHRNNRQFVDPFLPSGFAPFNVAVIGRHVLVSYAMQDSMKHDDVKGPGNGFIDEYTTRGFFLRRFASRGVLNSPWGMVVAPKSFGRFGGDLLVGNFGDGRINVFREHAGLIPLGTLRDENGQPISIDGLWGLKFGNGTFGDTNALVFTAGINDEADGLLGTITPAG